MNSQRESRSPVNAGMSGSSARLFQSQREATILVALLLLLATLVLYEPSLRNSFVNFDDPNYITSNSHVRHGLSWQNTIWAFTTVSEANWFPLTWLSHMADVQVFGMNAMGHHLDSIVWHALNVVLIFLLLRQATGYVLRSAIVASLFAVLPLNVEAVAWVAERKTLLCTTFMLLALFAYGWYARRPGILRYLVVALAFALGLMAKPMLVTLPALLVLADYWPLARFGRSDPKPSDVGARQATALTLMLEKIPLLVISVGSAVITLYAARMGGALSDLSQRPLGLRVQNAVWSYFVYIVKGIWPSCLAIVYPFPDKAPEFWKVGIAGLVLLLVSSAVWHYRARRYLVVGWFWFLVTLFPVIGIVQVGRQAMADRYGYTSFLGLFIIAVWGIADLAPRLKMHRATLSLTTVAVLCAYAWVSHVQLGYWRNSYTVFSHALQVTSRNGTAEDNLGVALLEMGNPDLAMPHLQAAVKYMPEFSTPHFNLATLLQSQKQFGPAIQEYQLAIDYTGSAKEASNAHNNLGSIFVAQNQLGPAMSEFNAAVSDDPTNVVAFLNRGLLEYGQRNLAVSESDFTRAVQLEPSADAFFFLGRTLEDMGNLEPAITAYESALKMAPGFKEVGIRLDALRRKLRS